MAGRPRKYNDGYDHIGILVPKEKGETLRKIAKARGQSITKLVQDAVDEWVAEHGPEIAPISMWFKEVPEPTVAQPSPDATNKEWNIYLQNADQGTLRNIIRIHSNIVDLAEQHLERRVSQGNNKVFFVPRRR